VHWFLDKLGEAWSDALNDDDDWSIPGIPCQTTFYRSNVAPILSRNDREKVFVIISDALRYEVASQLTEVIEKELRGEIKLSAQLGVLPSVTKLGMAALLPGKTLELIPGGNVLRDTLNTQGAPAREQVLKRNSNVEATVLSAADLLKMTVEEGREAIKPYRSIYIQQFAGSWGTVIFKSPIQEEVENLKCPPYACEPLYITMRSILSAIKPPANV